MKEGGGVTLSPRETKEESLRWSSLEKEVVGCSTNPRGQRVDRKGGGVGVRGIRAESRDPAASRLERSPGWRM